MNSKTSRARRAKKKKLFGVSYYKSKCWDLFSRVIRYRDCLKTTGSYEWGKCYTCGKLYSFNQFQAGHFVQGRKNAYLFDRRGVHIQCTSCNIFLHGNWPVYLANMKRDYGEEVTQELIDMYTSKETKQFKVFELQEMYQSLKNEIEAYEG